MTEILYRGHRDSRSARRLRPVLPTGEYIESRGVVATALALGALAAAATAGGAVASGAIQSHAAGEAAKQQTSAANYAADQQAKATADALAFQRQQAAQDQENFNSTSSANYGQWAAREARLSSIGQALGLPARNIPAFVPSPTLSATQTAPNTGKTAPGQQPSGNLSDPNAWMSLVSNTPALSSWVAQGLGPTASPDLVNYYVGKIKGQPGANPTEQAGSANYWMQKLQSDPNVTGRAAAPAAAGRPPVPATLGQAGGFMPTASTPYTPALMAPQVGSLAAYARRAY